MPLQSNAERNAKRAEDLPSVFGAVNLQSIRENVEEILKLIGRDGIFREYTLHDATHIDAMLALVDKLVPQDTAKIMRVADWLLLVLACYFHDLGMLVTKQEYDFRNDGTGFPSFKKQVQAGDKGKDYKAALESLDEDEREEFLYQEFVRENHAHRIHHWILGQDARQYGNATKAVEAVNELLSSLDKVVRDDLAKICLSHHQEDLFDIQKYPVSRIYGDNDESEANIQYISIMLRFVDVLQIQKKRVPTVLYKVIDPSNPKSQEEWAKQAGVRAIRIRPRADGAESDTISVHASFDKESAYFGLMAYIQQYAAKEVGRCYTWAMDGQKAGAKHRFPWKAVDASQVEPRGFEGRTYAFTLDQEKILTLLTGHTLYNDARVAVREVLQNALDAVRFRRHQFPTEPMGEIHVTWDSKQRRLSIRDTGTGMTQEIVEKFLLNVGASYYQSDPVLQKYGDFSPISRFGIGILSTFMIADEVQILTVHPDDEFARQLTLPSVVRSYLIRRFPKSDPSVQSIGAHGTTVTLQVRRSADLRSVTELVRHWLVIPNCVVTCAIDGGEPTRIGFPDAKSALDYYYSKSLKEDFWIASREVREAREAGIEVAYMVATSRYVDTWEFVRNEQPDHDNDEDDDTDDDNDKLKDAPGVCVEGIRVRTAPAGFRARSDTPWALVNLTGRDAPRTNVARSDLEQTPELDRVTSRVYAMLASHVQAEFDRLIEKGTGLIHAVNEAEIVLNFGLLGGTAVSPRALDQATSDLRILSIEEGLSCRAVSRRELEALDGVWTVESKLLDNVEGICARLGLNLPAEIIVERLGGKLSKPIPVPRFMGSGSDPLRNLEVSCIRTIQEERSVRLDLCWKKKASRWTSVPQRFLRRQDLYHSRPPVSEILITTDEEISKECPDFDVVQWKKSWLCLATSPIPSLVQAMGMSDESTRWLLRLLFLGHIASDERPLLKEQLIARGATDADALLAKMAIPRERVYGDQLWQRFWRGSTPEEGSFY